MKTNTQNKKTFLILQVSTLKSTSASHIITAFTDCFWTFWPRSEDTELLSSVQFCTVKYTKAQPLADDPCT